jgi:hypothetical protein
MDCLPPRAGWRHWSQVEPKLFLLKKYFFTGHTICTHLVGSLGSKYFFLKENKLRFIQIFSRLLLLLMERATGRIRIHQTETFFFHLKENKKMIIKGKYLQELLSSMRILIQRSEVAACTVQRSGQKWTLH